MNELPSADKFAPLTASERAAVPVFEDAVQDDGELVSPVPADAADGKPFEPIQAPDNAEHDKAHEHDKAPPQGDLEGGFVSWGDFTMSAKGLYTSKVRKGGDEPAKEEWISVAFEVMGACRDSRGCGWGKWLRWKDHDNRIHTRHVTDAALQGDPAALCAMLADEGLTINRSQQRALVSYLGGCHVKPRVMIVDRTGWHDIGGRQVFVLPSETIGPKGSEHVILDASAIGPYAAKGTLQDWQAGVGSLASGHALPILAVIGCTGWSAARSCRTGRRWRQYLWTFLDGQNDNHSSCGFRLGTRRNAGLCARLACDGERPGRRSRFGD
jgi:hypothetical protein